MSRTKTFKQKWCKCLLLQHFPDCWKMIHFVHWNKCFCLKIDLNAIVNCSTFSGATSLIYASVKKRAVLFLFRQIKKCSHLNSTFVNIGDAQAVQHTFLVNALCLLVSNSVFVNPMSTHSCFILFKCYENEWIREVARIV